MKRWRNRTQSGSALIGILIAALIIAILWAAKYRKSGKDTGPQAPGIDSVEDINRTLHHARQVQKENADRSDEIKKRMTEADRD